MEQAVTRQSAPASMAPLIILLTTVVMNSGLVTERKVPQQREAKGQESGSAPREVRIFSIRPTYVFSCFRVFGRDSIQP